MQIQEERVRELMVALGFKIARAWDARRLTGRVNKLHVVVDNTQDVQGSLKELFDEIVEANKRGEEITLVSGESADSQEAPKAPKKKSSGHRVATEEEPEKKKILAKKGKKPEPEPEPTPKKKKREVEPEPEPEPEPAKEVEVEEDADEGESQPSRRYGEKGPRPGVIAAIIEILQSADEESPVTKDQIADKLAERFPSRDRKKMYNTVNVQVPNLLRKKKNLHTQKNKDGYWLPANEES